jgi:CRISPR-associated protein Csb2
MTLVIRLKFPAKRYHATPWGSHVNEGQIEWPPSPWRLLRSFISVGFTKLRWSGPGLPELGRSLIEKLAATLPCYKLPAITKAHTRHYVAAANKKPLIFDTWARVQDGFLDIYWDLNLSPGERALLEQLVKRLTYLGRAESWVSGEIFEVERLEPNAFPASSGAPDKGWEAVSLLAALNTNEYEQWRSPRVESALAELAPKPGRKASNGLIKKQIKAAEPFPPTLIDCLVAETGWLQSLGWNRPPGSQEVLYWRAPERRIQSRQKSRSNYSSDTHSFVLLSISNRSRNRSALPICERSYSQSRLLHKAIAYWVGKLQVGRNTAAALLGLGEADGRPEQGHSHSHILHLDLDQDGHIDHVLIWTPRGLDYQALTVLKSLRRTFMKGGTGELQIAFVGSGDLAEIRRLGLSDSVVQSVVGGQQGAHVWESVTPFFVNRFIKKRGKNSIEGQIQRELIQRAFPEAEIEILPLRAERFRRFRQYTFKDRRHSPPLSQPFALKLTFKEAVHGPVCLGYGSHQGLGMLRALTSPTSGDENER